MNGQVSSGWGRRFGGAVEFGGVAGRTRCSGGGRYAASAAQAAFFNLDRNLG